MEIPKKFMHDRLILLLLSSNVFLAVLASLWVLLRLDAGRASAYIVQYRAPLGIGALKTGGAGELIAFILFAVMVVVIHGVLSVRMYRIKRELSVVILLLGILLLVLSIIVVNALLALR